MRSENGERPVETGMDVGGSGECGKGKGKGRKGRKNGMGTERKTGWE